MVKKNLAKSKSKYENALAILKLWEEDLKRKIVINEQKVNTEKNNCSKNNDSKCKIRQIKE